MTAAFDIIKSDLAVFNNLDEDHDGSISSREFQRGVQALPRTPALVKQLRKWADDIESERIAERLAKDKKAANAARLEKKGKLQPKKK